MGKVPRILAFAASGLLATAPNPPTSVEHRALQAGAHPSDTVLFLPLDPSFGGCLPLRAVCPDDASNLVLVGADPAAVRWIVEAAQVNEVALDVGTVEPIGTPPADPSASTFLVPVLDGAGVFLLHAPTRMSDEGLTPALPGPARDGTRVTPVLDDLPIPGASPSPRSARSIVREPRLVERDDLVGATPALLVRRSVPHRVVFGVRPDAGWRLPVDYLPLLERDGEAVLARAGSEIGLAIPPPPALVADAGGSGGGASGVPWPAAALVAGVVGIAGVVLVVRRQRR